MDKEKARVIASLLRDASERIVVAQAMAKSEKMYIFSGANTFDWIVLEESIDEFANDLGCECESLKTTNFSGREEEQYGFMKDGCKFYTVREVKR